MNWEQFQSEGDRVVRGIREGLQKRNINAGEPIITPFQTDEDIPIYNKIDWCWVSLPSTQPTTDWCWVSLPSTQPTTPPNLQLIGVGFRFPPPNLQLPSTQPTFCYFGDN